MFVIFQSEGQTALHIASAEGDETLVKYFYGVRASASIIDNQGKLMYITYFKNNKSIIRRNHQNAYQLIIRLVDFGHQNLECFSQEIILKRVEMYKVRRSECWILISPNYPASLAQLV